MPKISKENYLTEYTLMLYLHILNQKVRIEHARQSRKEGIGQRQAVFYSRLRQIGERFAHD